MKKVVISLGGSVIVPNKVNYSYLKKFKKLILKYSKKNKVVVICGGGSTARKYIDSLEGKKDKKIYGLVGIAATRLNARLVDGIFDRKEDIPETLNEVRKQINKHNLVICGSLGYNTEMTTDGNAAEIARMMKADFLVNITNVSGLYDKDPKKYKHAIRIPQISFMDFDRMVNKVKFKAGQHFVLDKTAAKIIKKAKIKTCIVDHDLDNFKRALYGKRFKGTLIS